jgi:hypothetical protein
MRPHRFEDLLDVIYLAEDDSDIIAILVLPFFENFMSLPSKRFGEVKEGTVFYIRLYINDSGHGISACANHVAYITTH